MLSKEKFVEGITILDVYYSNFKFFGNESFKGATELKKQVWYEVFKDMNDEAFITLIRKYCVANIYAPQSPTHLLEFGKGLIQKNMLSSDEAWQLINDELNKISIFDTISMTYIFDVEKTLSNIDNKYVRKVVEQMKDELKAYRNYDSWQVVKNKFINKYEELKNNAFYTDTLLLENKD